jgi:hypothetical protein
MGEIVRLIDYLAGRSSGQYTPNKDKIRIVVEDNRIYVEKAK